MAIAEDGGIDYFDGHVEHAGCLFRGFSRGSAVPEETEQAVAGEYPGGQHGGGKPVCLFCRREVAALPVAVAQVAP